MARHVALVLRTHQLRDVTDEAAGALGDGRAAEPVGGVKVVQQRSKVAAGAGEVACVHLAVAICEQQDLQARNTVCTFRRAVFLRWSQLVTLQPCIIR